MPFVSPRFVRAIPVSRGRQNAGGADFLRSPFFEEGAVAGPTVLGVTDAVVGEAEVPAGLDGKSPGVAVASSSLITFPRIN